MEDTASLDASLSQTQRLDQSRQRVGDSTSQHQQQQNNTNDSSSSGFNLVDARRQIFNKFPAELRAMHVYRHFYTDMDEEASQLSLQWFALLISYFCSLCRLEGRRVQYTQNGQSERFGAEFAKAHHRASVLFERVTSTYRRILATYNIHSRIQIRKKVGPKVLKETWKMERGGGGRSWRYTHGAKCDIEKLSHESQPAFLYALDELRFYEEFVNFTVEIMKKAFTDERLQTPIVKEVVLLFRSNSFNFKHTERMQVVNETKKSLADAQGADSILHNCHRLAARLVPPPNPVPLKLALRQRTPFVASYLNHPLLTQLSYQRAFARKEIKPVFESSVRAHVPAQNNTHSATYHVRLKEGQQSPHRKELEEINEEERNMNLTGIDREKNTTKTPLGQRRKQKNRQQRNRSNSPNQNNRPSSAIKAPAPSSKDYWNRVGTSKEENEYTVEVHQPMFSPSHRALSSLTPVAVVRARQRSAQKKKFSEAKDKILTELPADSILPRLVDFDKADKIEESGFLPRKVDAPIDHATSIMFGGQSEAGAASNFLPMTMSVGGVLIKTGGVARNGLGKNAEDEYEDDGGENNENNNKQSGGPKKSLASRFSSIAKRIATASTVRTNPESRALKQKKAFDKLVTETAAVTPMSCQSRTYIEQDPTQFFVAPIDEETGQEDFTLYDPSDDIDAVYQQLAHGVQLSHFEVPIDLGVQYDDTGLLVVNS